MRHYGKDTPTPLPVQALDYATGFIVATAAVSGLAERVRSGNGSSFRTALARIAVLLDKYKQSPGAPELAEETEADLVQMIEETHWGPARRLSSAVTVSDVPVFWDIPAGPIGTAKPIWSSC